MEEPTNFSSDQEDVSKETREFFRYVIAPILAVIFSVLIYLAIK